jgi:hypothetical protein
VRGAGAELRAKGVAVCGLCVVGTSGGGSLPEVVGISGAVVGTSLPEVVGSGGGMLASAATVLVGRLIANSCVRCFPVQCGLKSHSAHSMASRCKKKTVLHLQPLRSTRSLDCVYDC